MTNNCELVVKGGVISHHIVQLFDTHASLIKSVAAFLEYGFDAGDTLLVVARPTYWKSIAKCLKRAGYPVDDAMSVGRLTVLDASATLASFMRRGAIAPALFEEIVGSCVGRLAGRAGHGLRIYGEMVDLLAEEGNLEAAHELEELWNELAERYSFTLLCGYAAAHFTDPLTAQALRAICDAHTRVDTKSDDTLGNWVLKKADNARRAMFVAQPERSQERFRGGGPLTGQTDYSDQKAKTC